MSTDAATPETPVPPDPDGETDGSAVHGSPSDEPNEPDETSQPDESSGSAPPDEASDASDDSDAADDSDDTEGSGEPAGPVLAHVPAPAEPVHDTTREASAAVGPVPDDAGGRLTARLREARARLEPEQTVIPAPRTPEGVVPPAAFGRGGGRPPADLLRAVDELAGRFAELEDDDGRAPERRALLRALDRSTAGVPDGGWSGEDRVDAEALAGAAELAGSLHAAATSLVERLDAAERTGSAVEVDAVATALQVARVVLDLEAFARHGR